jgi:Spy/CpxP family protein refolding chaperone
MNVLSGALLAGLALSCAAQTPPVEKLPDPIVANFYAPELVRMAQPALALTEQQQTDLSDAVGRIQPHIAATQKLLQEETRKLSDISKPDKLEEEAVMAQGDKVLALERELRRANLALLIKIKSILTPEQQAKLRDLRSKTEAFQTKVRQAMALAEKLKQAGRDPAPFERSRTEFEDLMKAGKFQQAEDLLDQTIKWLNTPKAP